MVRFLHCGDLHLGYQQYNLEQRYKDFFYPFAEIIDYACNNKITYILIVGDLFHKKDLNPETLQRTEEILKEARDSGIQIIVTEGNHDNKHSISGMSWLQYLDSDGLIYYLSDLTKVIPEELVIAGIKYYGASTKKHLDETLKLLEENKDKLSTKQPRILMLHAGVVGQIPNTGNIKPEDLMRFREFFDYIALGHIHKPYEIENFIFNPGSTENCSIAESEFHGGFYDVTIDEKGVKSKHIETKKRSMVRIERDITNGFDYDTKECLDLPHGMNDQITEITFIGTCEKNNINKFITKLREDNQNKFYLKIVDKTTRPNKDIKISESSREEIERKVVNELTKDENITQLIFDIKDSEDEDEVIYKKFQEMIE